VFRVGLWACLAHVQRSGIIPPEKIYNFVLLLHPFKLLIKLNCICLSGRGGGDGWNTKSEHREN